MENREIGKMNQEGSHVMPGESAFIETKRLRLRPLLKNDRENLMKLLSDPVVMEFYEGAEDETKADEWIERSRKLYKEMRIGFLGCELKETGEFLGVCGLLFQPAINGRDEIEVGYLLVREFWGQGFATEAARGCMDYGFDEKGYKRIVSLIDPKNHRSIRVAERNGLKRDGKAIFKGRDVLVFAAENPSCGPS